MMMVPALPVFHTFFWTPDGAPLPFERLQHFQHYQVEPFVELEDIFINKAVRTLQLKLRECIVYPPAERLDQAFFYSQEEAWAPAAV